MGQAAFEVHQTAPQNPIHQSADKLQTHRLPRRHRRAGRGYVLSVGKTTRRKGRRNRTAQSRKPNAVGEANEQYPQPCNRDCKCRVDKCIIKWWQGLALSPFYYVRTLS